MKIKIQKITRNKVKQIFWPGVELLKMYKKSQVF